MGRAHRAIAMTAQMRVDELARAAISFPTYAEVLFYAAVRAAVELGSPLSGQLRHVGAKAMRALEVVNV